MCNQPAVKTAAPRKILYSNKGELLADSFDFWGKSDIVTNDKNVQQ